MTKNKKCLFMSIDNIHVWGIFVPWSRAWSTDPAVHPTYWSPWCCQNPLWWCCSHPWASRSHWLRLPRDTVEVPAWWNAGRAGSPDLLPAYCSVSYTQNISSAPRLETQGKLSSSSLYKLYKTHLFNLFTWSIQYINPSVSCYYGNNNLCTDLAGTTFT